MAADPPESPRARLERELRALVPVAISVDRQRGLSARESGEHVVRLVLRLAGPLFDGGDHV